MNILLELENMMFQFDLPSTTTRMGGFHLVKQLDTIGTNDQIKQGLGCPWPRYRRRQQVEMHGKKILQHW